MRLAERDKRTCYLRPAGTDDRNAYKEPLTVWGVPIEIRATVQPLRGSIEATIYGERVRSMHRLLYDGPVKVREGDGICIDVKPDELPDYRVVYAVRTRIDVERLLPEQRRAP